MAYRFRIVSDFHFFESHRLRFHLERGHVSYMNFKQVRMNVYCACKTQTCLANFRSVVSRGLATSKLKKVLDAKEESESKNIDLLKKLEKTALAGYRFYAGAFHHPCFKCF